MGGGLRKTSLLVAAGVLCVGFGLLFVFDRGTALGVLAFVIINVVTIGVLIGCILAAFGIVELVLRFVVRPPRANECGRCRYDLSGLPDGAACPECGLEGAVGAVRSRRSA